MNLELYQYYTRNEIFAALGKPKRTEAEGWFLAAEQLVGMFAIGECSPANHFCDANRFHWHAQNNEPVPQAVADFNKLNGGLLFIKSPTADRYAYVSQIAHVGMHGGGPDSQQAMMDISPPIPTELLHDLGGLYVHPNGDSAMNESVRELRAAQTPDGRFAAFQQFVEVWRGPLEAGHRLSDADLARAKLPIPKILAKLYRWAGACDDVMQAGYLAIRRPEELSANKYGYVAFCVECQWCGNYFLRRQALQDEDPEVFADECGSDREGAGYHATGIGLSKFLWAYYIAFNIDRGPLSYQIELTGNEFRRVKEILDPLPVLASGSQGCRAVQAYNPEIPKNNEAYVIARDGVMGYVTHERRSTILYLRSKMRSAVEALLASVNIAPKRLLDSP